MSVGETKAEAPQYAERGHSYMTSSSTRGSEKASFAWSGEGGGEGEIELSSVAMLFRKKKVKTMSVPDCA
jgi:hypothetical protein